MRPVLLLVATTSLAAAAAYALVVLTAPPAAMAAAAEPELTQRLADLQRSHDEVTRQVRELQRRLTAAEIAGGRQTVPTLSDAQVGEAVERWLAQHGPARGDDGAVHGAGTPALTGAAADAELEHRFRQLQAGGMSDEQVQALWNDLQKAQLLDRMVAMLEQRAKEQPDDAAAQAQLGDAYIQQVIRAPDGPQKGTLAIKADQQFDKALKIDPRHWQARFAKATSLAFWPPLFGKQPDAIKNFEVLIGQQEEARPEPRQAAAYLLLGNLYQQQGKTDKAHEVWQKGLQRHPDNQSLREKLDAK